MKYIFLALLAVAAVALTGIALGNTRTVASNGEQRPIPSFGTANTDPALPPINAPAGASVIIFGDSWTAGYAATPSSEGYAYLTGADMGWETSVRGVSGTGYLNAGPNAEGTYAQRIAELPDAEPSLFIMQGGINDAFQDQSTLGEAIDATLAAVRSKYPTTQIVLLGPAPSALPVEANLSSVDNDLRGAARSAGIHYVSPIAENWITAENYQSVIDETAAGHPSTAGHRYLADKTIEALRNILG
ncbi:hypothetical protein A4X17_11215 [Plantibacter sp. H53]|nr:hypothetical protein A4X17_11215 [Plantibacter sp. H53]